MRLIIDIPNYNLNDVQNGSIACSQILKAVKNGTPYEERPTGEWVFDGFCVTSTKFKCSACLIPELEKTNYCPNCGAKMEK